MLGNDCRQVDFNGGALPDRTGGTKRPSCSLTICCAALSSARLGSSRKMRKERAQFTELVRLPTSLLVSETGEAHILTRAEREFLPVYHVAQIDIVETHFKHLRRSRSLLPQHELGA